MRKIELDLSLEALIIKDKYRNYLLKKREKCLNRLKNMEIKTSKDNGF